MNPPQLLQNAVGKYYDVFNEILLDLAKESIGGEEASITFPAGKITIKLT
jgi:hypothetical protein